MESDTVETVTEWSSVPFSDGHAGLRDLADREFTGAVTDGAAWLFMLNGRVVGVFDGTIESFAEADGTAYEAPHPSLPLLYAMRERGGETRAKYYTEETPLSEVDRTLKSGNFTGYVELSENVLSGDYYTVYHGGKAMSAAYVGNNRRLITGDDAFQRAADEVGIYVVKTVDVDITEIPGPDPASDTGASGVVSDGPNTDDAGTDDASESAGSSDESGQTQGGVTFGGTDPLGGERADESTVSDETDPESVEPRGSDPRDSESTPSETEAETPTTTDEGTHSGTDSTDDDPLAESGEPNREKVSPATSERDEPQDETDDRQQSPPPREEPRQVVEQDVQTEESEPDEQSSGESVFDDESQWRDARTIPALDPSDTSVTEPADRNGTAVSQPTKTRQQRQEAQTGQTQERRTTADSTVDDLRAERERLARRVEELESETERVQAENEELRRVRDRLGQERDEAGNRVSDLEAEVAELQSTIQSLESQLADAEQEASADQGPSGTQVPVDRAFDGTNLFVRYRRKSGATLDDAYDGTVTREEVNENIRLEYHTDFDAETAVVDDASFDEWLEGTVEYGFSRWVVQEFIHDIRETRNQSALEELYEAIPDIDRIQFHGAVDVPDVDGGSESRTFDVVMRDRMGEPLLVADLNDSREPATEAMLSSLVENATPVGEAVPDLAGAFFVTTSYFEPGALETAHEATGGGLLRRERRKSFVKLSRKDGYHLCLVETRNGEFHVNVPEL